MKEAEPIVIVADTRERLPYEFRQHPGVKVVRRALGFGDYAPEGWEDLFVVERKSLQDLVQSLSWERKRFVRELQRTVCALVFSVVVEADWDDVVRHRYSTGANPTSIAAGVLSLGLRYNVRWYFAGSRGNAEELTFQLLTRGIREWESISARLGWGGPRHEHA